MHHTRVSARSVSILGFLVAAEIILARFSIHTWNIKIGFSFLPVVVAAIFYGPAAGGLTAAAGDIAGAVLFPAGAYFPGFTLTAFLAGAVFGLCLRRKVTAVNAVLAVLIVQGLIGQFINTYWISILYGSPYWPLFISRLYQTGFMSVVQAAGILLVEKKLLPALKRWA